VVAELLDEDAERRGLVSDGQYGSRRRRSEFDTATKLDDRVHAARREGHIPVVRLMDIKAAFQSVLKGILIHTMRDKGRNGDLTQWTARFLPDRTVKIVIEGDVMERDRVEPDIPQGSPVTPILFAIYISKLKKVVVNRVFGEEGLSSVYFVGWVATGNNVNQVMRKLEACA
jgi:hypothetical protein